MMTAKKGMSERLGQYHQFGGDSYANSILAFNTVFLCGIHAGWEKHGQHWESLACKQDP